MLFYRGKSDGKKLPFREWCGRIAELRAVVKVPVLALTATASKSTRLRLIRDLEMQDCIQIIRSPDRANIRLSVVRMSTDPAHCYGPLIQLLRRERKACPRVLVYCSRVNTCTLLYTTFHQVLGNDSYFPPSEQGKMRNSLIALFHSGCTENSKEHVLSSLRQPDGVCRVVFATSALGMGVDVKGLNTVIHHGPPETLEEYQQEIGRAGRDGSDSEAVLLVSGLLMRHVSKEMRDYAYSQDICRRKMLLESFGASRAWTEVDHKCCDVCTRGCSCGSQFHPSSHPLIAARSDSVLRTRMVSAAQQQQLRLLLCDYVDLEQYSSSEDDSLHHNHVTPSEVDVLIHHSHVIFKMDDIVELLQVSDTVARDVLMLFSQVFSDCHLEDLSLD